MKSSISENEFAVKTKEELLTLSYGEKGSKKREQAEKRIKHLSDNISLINQKKEMEENKSKI